MPSPTGTTAETLANLAVGQRLWYWFSPEATHPLVMTTLRDDPSMETIRDEITRTGLPLGEVGHLGLAGVRPDGTLNFGSRELDGSALSRLARWAAEHAEAWPELRRLKGASVTQVGPDGVVDDILEDGALWSDLQDLPVPGTPAGAAWMLAQAEVDVPYSCWITDRSSQGTPAIALGRPDDPPLLFSQVRALKGDGKVVFAFVVKDEAGALTVSPNVDLDEARKLLQTLVDAYPEELRLLDGATVAKADSLRGEASSLAQTEAVLTELQPDGKLAFAFTDRHGPVGEPMLWLETNPTRLRAAAEPPEEGATQVFGTLLPRDGFLLFRSKTPMDGFVPLLAQWMRTHQATRPGLTRLHGSRFVVVNAEGKQIERHKDDAAWASE